MKWVVCLYVSMLVASAGQPAKEIFDRAARELAAENYAAAERDFQAVLRLEPNHAAALGNLGVIYSRTGRADRAVTSYRRALELSPGDKALLLNLGLLYLKQEDHKRAMPLFERVVEIDPQHTQARELLAVCRAYLGELGPAIRELEALRGAAPDDPNILFLLGFAYLKQHDTEKAKSVFARMLEAAGPAPAAFLAGKANYEAAMFADAEQNLREALRLDPAIPGAHVELGKVYISLRRTDDAVRELELALRTAPGDADASYFLGAVLVQDGRYAEGVPHLERARAAKPDFWAPYFYLGKAKLRMERPAEAVNLLQRAVKLNGEDVAAYDLLARALEACGRQAEARQAMAKVRQLRAGTLQPVTAAGGVVGAR